MLTIQSEEAVFENTQKNLSHENVNFKIQTNVLKNIFPTKFSNFLERDKNISKIVKQIFFLQL